MKKLLLTISSLCLLLGIGAILYAVDLVWKDKYGARYFQCAGSMVGGQAKVKAIGANLFRVKSGIINREIQADSIHHAAQIACGEREQVGEPPENPDLEQEPTQETN